MVTPKRSASCCAVTPVRRPRSASASANSRDFFRMKADTRLSKGSDRVKGMKNSINWFEIPTRDMDKAVAFYEKALGVTLKRELFGGLPHGVFPADKGAATGAVVAAPHLVPASAGVVIYLDAPDGVRAVLTRAKAAGAAEVQPHTSIGEFGWIAVV